MSGSVCRGVAARQARGSVVGSVAYGPSGKVCRAKCSDLAAGVPMRLVKCQKREGGGYQMATVRLFSIHRRRVGLDG